MIDISTTETPNNVNKIPGKREIFQIATQIVLWWVFMKAERKNE